MWSSAATRRAIGAPLHPSPGLGFPLEPGARVGLYGGSFNPVHDGHVHVARTALRRLGLDRIVWLVSPQNPLKSADDTADLEARLAGARRAADHPRMRVSALESQLGLAYTVDTLRWLTARYPHVRFVWIMGADNLLHFHRWRGWADILRLVPVAVVDRPGAGLKGRLAPAAQRFARARLPESRARQLAAMRPPAWIYLTAPLYDVSSTRIRQARRQSR